jgi:hypothetical protein
MVIFAESGKNNFEIRVLAKSQPVHREEIPTRIYLAYPQKTVLFSFLYKKA